MFLRSLRTCGRAKALQLCKAYCATNSSSNQLQRYEDDLAAEFQQLLRESPAEKSVLAVVPNPSAVEVPQNIRPAFNFAAYVNKSETLQQLVALGVDLYKLERRKGIPQFMLGLDFEKDMRHHVRFLADVGVPASSLGDFLTRNPLIFKENIDDLQTRINYLQAKRFLPEQIERIVVKNPFWLMINTKRIDRRLGYFQKTFSLHGNEVRVLTTKQPRLITYNLEHIRKSTFAIREEMGFELNDMKQLLLAKPTIWMTNQEKLLCCFDYLHRRMKLTHSDILRTPDILLSRDFRIKQRHGFLQLLGKAQYDPRKDLFISLKSLVQGTDEEFVTQVAKSNMECYNSFLKTL